MESDYIFFLPDSVAILLYHKSSMLARDEFSTSKMELVTRTIVSFKHYRIFFSSKLSVALK